MLLEFSCSNIRSIKEKVTFSMLAGTDNSMEECLCNFANYRVLRSSVIYGANGSGKSTFLFAISRMKSLVCSSFKLGPDQHLYQPRHKLSSEDEPSEYRIQFVKKGIRYAYGFSVVQSAIKDEYLYYFPNGKKTTVFTRDGMDVKFGSKYAKDFALCGDALKDNRLFLSCAANLSKVEVVGDAYDFFATDLVIFNSDRNNWLNYSLSKMRDDADLKKFFIDTLRSLGTMVNDIEIREERFSFNKLPQAEQDMFSDSAKELMGKNESVLMDAKLIYDNFEVELRDESAGVMRLFQMLCPIFDILQNDKVLICDEIENSLHESIVDQVVKLFQNQNQGKSAQLIFTTHDTSLMDADLFRRDQIWFTQMTEERTTDLYSLVEIRDVRKYENKSRQYLSGKYGAIPVCNDSFFEGFGDMADKGETHDEL